MIGVLLTKAEADAFRSGQKVDVDFVGRRVQLPETDCGIDLLALFDSKITIRPRK